MVRDGYQETGGRKFVARSQGSGKSCGDSLAPVSSGGVDSSGTRRGQRLLQISRRVKGVPRSRVYDYFRRTTLSHFNSMSRSLAKKQVRTLNCIIFVPGAFSLTVLHF